MKSYFLPEGILLFFYLENFLRFTAFSRTEMSTYKFLMIVVHFDDCVPRMIFSGARKEKNQKLKDRNNEFLTSSQDHANITKICSQREPFELFIQTQKTHNGTKGRKKVFLYFFDKDISLCCCLLCASTKIKLIKF